MTSMAQQQSRTAGRWTREQHEKFLYGLKIYGKNWKKIQDLIQNRSSTQIRSHAQKYFIKMKKSQKFDQESQNMENDSQSKYAQQTILSPYEQIQVETKKNQYSYYMDKIVQNYVVLGKQGKQFNFWDCLVDSRPTTQTKSFQLLNLPQQIQLEMRKNVSCHQLSNQNPNQERKPLERSFSCFGSYKGDQ